MAEEKSQLSLVTFVAHPIDGIKCAGGLFAKYARRGHKVTNVVFQEHLGRGELSPSLSMEEVHKEAERQSRRASAKIGAGVELLKYAPLSMSIIKDEEEVVRRVADLIRKLKAEFFYFPYDRYPYGRRAFDEIPWNWLSVPKTKGDLGGHERLSLPVDF